MWVGGEILLLTWRWSSQEEMMWRTLECSTVKGMGELD
jgi:hypothetical protein